MDKTAQERLADHIRAAGKKKQAFAEEIGVSPGQLSRWLSGAVIPSRQCRTLIEVVTGIPRDSWA
jgi:DNA-binding transcriptional regulator YiaG